MSVYTSVSVAEATDLLALYDVGRLVSITGITEGIENSNFFVSTTQGEYVLTVFEHHQPHELHYFMTLMQHWATTLPVACPIEQRNGKFLIGVKAKPAALIKRLPGEHLAHPTLQQCATLGAVTARMHISAEAFPLHRPPDRGNAWRLQTAYSLMPQLSSQDAALLEHELAFQQAFNFELLPKGTIHADLFRDNMLFVGDTLTGILDLYFACYDSWLYDLAIVVNDWCTDTNGQQDPKRVQSCLDAYQALRPWTALEQAYWPAVLRAAALRFWLSRLAAQLNPREGAIAWQKDPDEFRAKLRYLQSNFA